jgi:uncharacterized protein YutE (UPF0331/DUF86 family)
LTGDEVLLSKAESIERCLRRVRDTHVGREAALDHDLDQQDIVVLNLQRACEQAIDMANRMIELRRLRYPKDSADSFAILAGAGLLDPGTADAMARMVGFRDVAVHAYRDLDLAVVRAIVEHRLGDLLAFSKAMLQADPTR